MDQDLQREPQRPAQWFTDFPFEMFEEEEPKHRPMCVTITKPISEVWSFFRDFENHSRFLKPDTKLDFRNIEIISEKPGRMLAWKTTGEDSFQQIGAFSVHEGTGGRGTVVSMRVAYVSMLGKAAAAVQTPMGKGPDMEAYQNLRRLKAYLETGEVPTTEGQPNGNDENELELKH